MNSESDSVKLNTVYIWAGAQAETLVEARLAERSDLKIEKASDLLDCLGTCLAHSTFYREAREDFYSVKQKQGESTTTYYSRILELYQLSDFPANTDFLITDKLIHGCINTDSKRKLMVKSRQITLRQCLDIMRQHEAVDTTMRRIEGSALSTSHVNATSVDPTRQSQRKGNKTRSKKFTKKSSNQTDSSSGTQPCTWCARGPHPRERCPAKDATCNFCQKNGHFESACRQKKRMVKGQNAVSVDDSSDSDYELTYDMDHVLVDTVESKARVILAAVKFHTAKAKMLQGKVDTGAMVTCMPLSLMGELGLHRSDLKPTKAHLRGVTGADMKTLGELNVRVTCNDIEDEIKVMVTELGSELILGIDFCKQFDLVTVADTCIQRQVNVSAVHITEESEANYSELRQKWGQYIPLGKKTGDPLEDVKQLFPEMFDGQVGLFDGEVELKLSPEAKPVQLPPRAIPQSVLPELKKELDKMEREGIIRTCPETTEWVHNLVIAKKKNGALRICLDPRNLNKHLIRSVHHTASWEDAQHSFRNGVFFSTLDAKSGYWTKKLSTQSQLLTAFNTPFKKYCFKRLPFGLSVSSEIFCEQMDRALNGIPGTFPCADDVKIQGSDEERHDLHLLETIDRAREAGIKFNPDKCQIKKQQISYFGRVITPNGVQPCPKKVKDILKLAPPTNKQELQSFFGTINFMATFIPNLSKQTHMMRGLLKKDIHFAWTSDMQLEFEHIKQAIADEVQLTHFDPNKPTVIETDGSLKGLGAVLIQDHKPVKFLSKSLTPAEAEYSNIERELLAVLFACEKLHSYVFGCTVTIHTDHKPLESIFQKPISLAPARLQRMLIRLRMYDLRVKYVGAKSVLLADTLSRLVDKKGAKTIPDLDVSIAQVLHFKPSYLEALQAEAKVDPTQIQLFDYIMNGWPEHMQDLPDDIRPYWCFRDELAILDGLIMKGNRVVVPAVMRSDTLTRLHDGHQGLTTTLQRARRTVYWPKLQDDVSELILKCENCQKFGKKKPKTAEKQISASRPMEILGIDLMDFKGEHAMVAIDYFSGYVMVDYIQNETSEAVIATLNNNFRKFGLAEKIISDNGPCFKSEKFNQFCEDLEISHITSSPHYHQSNGRAERAIQTVKQILKKCQTQKEITVALLAYLDSPIDNDLPSPGEILFGRRINTRLVVHRPTQLADADKTKLMQRRSAHLPSTTGDPRDQFVPNQPIWFTEDGYPEWKPGFVDVRDPLPDSYWIVSSETNRRIRRNKHDLKPRVPIVAEQNVPNNYISHLPLDPELTEDANAPSQSKMDAETLSNNQPTPGIPTPPAPSPKAVVRTRSGRESKPYKDPSFVYVVSV